MECFDANDVPIYSILFSVYYLEFSKRAPPIISAPRSPIPLYARFSSFKYLVTDIACPRCAAEVCPNLFHDKSNFLFRNMMASDADAGEIELFIRYKWLFETDLNEGTAWCQGCNISGALLDS
jgi:hypothetical protein